MIINNNRDPIVSYGEVVGGFLLFIFEVGWLVVVLLMGCGLLICCGVFSIDIII